MFLFSNCWLSNYTSSDKFRQHLWKRSCSEKNDGKVYPFPWAIGPQGWWGLCWYILFRLGFFIQVEISWAQGKFSSCSFSFNQEKEKPMTKETMFLMRWGTLSIRLKLYVFFFKKKNSTNCHKFKEEKDLRAVIFIWDVDLLRLCAYNQCDWTEIRSQSLVALLCRFQSFRASIQ